MIDSNPNDHERGPLVSSSSWVGGVGGTHGKSMPILHKVCQICINYTLCTKCCIACLTSLPSDDGRTNLPKRLDCCHKQVIQAGTIRNPTMRTHMLTYMQPGQCKTQLHDVTMHANTASVAGACIDEMLIWQSKHYIAWQTLPSNMLCCKWLQNTTQQHIALLACCRAC